MLVIQIIATSALNLTTNKMVFVKRNVILSISATMMEFVQNVKLKTVKNVQMRKIVLTAQTSY